MNSNLQRNASFALELDGVSRHFGALVALSGLNIRIAAGERRAVLGSNGAGKTTLFNVITGDFLPTTGSIRFFGEDITALPAHERIRRGLRRTYQISQLFGGLTVLENVYLACRGVTGNRFSMLRAKRNDVTMSQAEAILKTVYIESNAQSRVENLSHGEKRQLEIAMALAGAPRFILFDEPAAGLSPTERRELVLILNSLPKHIGFILIEHDLDVALRVSEYITMMHNGEIFKEGTPEEIESDAQVQEIYLGGKNG